MSSLLAAALVAAAVGIGSWKVVEVRQENARLALQAKTCMARNEAFLAMMRAAGESRGTPAAVVPGP
jgi:protein-disulfide isomerase